MKFPLRAGHLALIFPLALLAATACGDTPGDDDGSGGSSSDEDGSGGSDGSTDEDGSGGEAGGSTDDDGSGGDDDGSGGDSDGSGGDDDGSGGDSDGSGGTGSGGLGSGGISGDCGNNQPDALEQCDDGNGDDDTCTGACTLAACDECREDQCAAYGDYLSCEGLDAALKPGCEQLLGCYRGGCADEGDSRVCYCGDGGEEKGTQAYEDFMAACFVAFAASDLQAGVCRSAIETVTGLTSPIGIGTSWLDPATAVGFANQTVQCEHDFCAVECDYAEESGTGGSSGTGGAGSGGSSSGGSSGSGGDNMGGATGSGGDSGSGGATGCSEGQEACDDCVACRTTECAAEFAVLYTPGSGTCFGSNVCPSYRSCIDSTGCSLMSGASPQEELINCYCGSVPEAECFGTIDPGVPQGLCAAEVHMVAGLSNPSQVEAMFFDGVSTIGSLNEMFLCQKVECETECAPYFGAP